MADIGSDTVVGAGAVVTHMIPDRVVAAGVPARVIRKRNEPTAANPDSADKTRTLTASCVNGDNDGSA
jgi:acetyltransferase-like isoleucine patch superfamily enzyme